MRGLAAAFAGALLGLVGVTFSGYLLWAQFGPIGAICQWCLGNDVVISVVTVLCVARMLTEPAQGRMSRRGALLFAAMCVIWGIPYLLIRVAVRELAPVTLVFARTAIGAVLLRRLRRAAASSVRFSARWKPLLVYTASRSRSRGCCSRAPRPADELADRAPDRRRAARGRADRDADR